MWIDDLNQLETLLKNHDYYNFKQIPISKHSLEILKSIHNHNNTHEVTTTPPEVTTTVGLADSSSNYLPVNGNATPGDRGEESETIHGSRGEVNREAATASGKESSTGPRVEPAADLREAEGDVNKKATTASGKETTSGKGTASGKKSRKVDVVDSTSSGVDEVVSSNRYSSSLLQRLAKRFKVDGDVENNQRANDLNDDDDDSNVILGDKDTYELEKNSRTGKRVNVISSKKSKTNTSTQSTASSTKSKRTKQSKPLGNKAGNVNRKRASSTPSDTSPIEVNKPVTRRPTRIALNMGLVDDDDDEDEDEDFSSDDNYSSGDDYSSDDDY